MVGTKGRSHSVLVHDTSNVLKQRATQLVPGLSHLRGAAVRADEAIPQPLHCPPYRLCVLHRFGRRSKAHETRGQMYHTPCPTHDNKECYPSASKLVQPLNTTWSSSVKQRARFQIFLHEKLVRACSRAPSPLLSHLDIVFEAVGGRIRTALTPTRSTSRHPRPSFLHRPGSESAGALLPRSRTAGARFNHPPVD